MLHVLFRAKYAAGIITSIAGAGIFLLAAPAGASTIQHPAVKATAGKIRVAAGPSVISVHPGDTLSEIAAAYCGSPQDWSGIYQANKSLLTSGPDTIYPGQVLRVNCGSAQVSYQSPSPVAVTTTARTTVGSSSFQSCVISRESGGNPAAVNPASGAGGLYQFLPSTWASLGFSGLPENAPVSEQNEAFAKLYAQAGSSPWAPSDGC